METCRCDVIISDVQEMKRDIKTLLIANAKTETKIYVVAFVISSVVPLVISYLEKTLKS